MKTFHTRSRSIAVEDPSRVGEARRLAVDLSEEEGLNATKSGQVAIIATELATNILKHARSGEIVMRTLDDGDRKGIELLSLDKGPGMSDFDKCLRDGYSTAGSCGTGLGSISRLSTHFEAYSVPEQGTALLSQVWSEGNATYSTPGFVYGAICLPVHDGERCGDGWAIKIDRDHLSFLLVDGLGHGEFAADAADEAIRVFDENQYPELEEQMHYMHGALKKTRGAAVALGKLDLKHQKLRYAGVGNISGNLFNNLQCRSLLSHNGTIGHVINKVKEFDYDWTADSLLVLHSDGLSSKWDFENYPGLHVRHPSLIAGVLYRDCRRSRDDASVMVVREAG
jgi:anti-sigma regulatory factor (Ser/Thr protein kinase)